MMIIRLFFTFALIGLLSIGGGYAILPQIHHQVVQRNAWLTPEEFADLIAISQMTPGPISLNASTFVGTKLAGIPGAIAATLGCVAPSFVLVILLAYLYGKYKKMDTVQGALSGLRPAVVGMIAAASVTVFILALFGDASPSFAALSYKAVALVVACFAALRIFKANPILVIGGAGVVGILWHYLGPILSK